MAAVPVAVTGFTWTAALMALANVLIGGGMLAAWVRTRPALKKIANERETGLLEVQAGEMVKLSRRVEQLEAKLESQRADYEAQLGIHRHRANNIAACLDALLLMLELRPERVPEAVARIKQMRAEQTAGEVNEKATVAAAKIVAAGSLDT
jgi:hypothetical protein